MIARKWTGVVLKRDADAYGEFLSGDHGIGGYRSATGNRGALLLRRDGPTTTEFEMISIWDDVDAIKGYTGGEYDQPRYYPADLAALIDPPKLVEHRQVVACELPKLNVGERAE